MKKIFIYAILISIMGTNISYAEEKDNTVLNAETQQSVKNYKKYYLKTEKVSPVKNKYEYINLDWWAKFNDDYLNDYIIRAVENNKDLNMASLAVEEFYQNVVMQRASEMPSITAGLMPGYGKIMGQTSGNWALPVIANYELDLFGKNHNKTTSVKKLYESSILDEKSAYISVVSAVGTLYVNIVRLDAVIDLQEKIVDLRKEIYDIMNVSNKEGIISTSDLVKANQGYVLGNAELIDLKKERTKLLHQLAVLVGDSPENIEEYKRCDYRTLTFSGTIPNSVKSEIIMNRPDYLKAEKMLEKAGIDVRVARKELLPSLNLGGGILFANKNIDTLFTASNMIWGLGGQIMQPIFRGGALRANLKSKKIAYERSLKNYEKVNLTSMQEVNDSLVSVNLDKEKLTKQRSIQELEIKDYRLTKLKYDEGIIPKLDLDQKEENLLSVNKTVYMAEFDCLVDYINFYKAIAAQEV